MADAPSTAIPAKPAAFQHPMPALSGRLAGVGAIKIVAIGSSTTTGEGDIVPYPQRLENVLRLRYLGRNFDVLNRGVRDLFIDPIALNGQDLHFEIHNGGTTYDGKLNAEGTAIEGTWKQSGASAPLVLKRAKK